MKLRGILRLSFWLFLKTTNKILFVLLVIVTNSIAAQQKIDTTMIYSSPVTFPIPVSGTFAELRSNHFHSGIDISSYGVIGKPVVSIADGWVSRIKVSPYGYGNALYITHPNHSVSVYGHLDKYAETIHQFVLEYQYSRQVFSFDMHLDSGKIMVSKGQKVGYIGNTGSSGGPHLHFEIREEESEMPTNPFLYKNLEATDNIPPIIQKIRFVPLNSTSTINNLHKSFEYQVVQKEDGVYQLRNAPPLIFSGNVGIQIMTYDRLNSTYNHNGVYSIKMLIDSVLKYKFVMNRFSFDNSRALNSHIDYAHYKITSDRFHKCYIDPGNPLCIYKHKLYENESAFYESRVYPISIIVSDIFGNRSVFEVKVNGFVPLSDFSSHVEKNEYGKPFFYDQMNYYTSKECIVFLRNNTLYKDMYFHHKSYDELTNFDFPIFSKIHDVGNRLIPVHEYYTLMIKTNREINVDSSHLFLGSIWYSKKTGKPYASFHSSLYSEFGMQAEVRNFGLYAIIADTIPPEIKPDKAFQKANPSQLAFIISDELSGIKEFNAYINNEWVLLSYDAKNDRLCLDKENIKKKGKLSLKIILHDNANNQTVYREALYF